MNVEFLFKKLHHNNVNIEQKCVLAGYPGTVSCTFSYKEEVETHPIFPIIHISPINIARRIEWNSWIGLLGIDPRQS